MFLAHFSVGLNMGVKRGRFSGLSRSKIGAGRLQKRIRAAVPLISSFALAACAIHPVQQDVTGVPTAVLVKHIRCETRLAIQDKALQMLRDYRAGGDQASELADTLSAIRGKTWHVNPNRDLTDAKERAFYFRYIQTGVAYDLTFDITEDNSATLAADPVRLITNGMYGIGLNSTGDFSRENSRHFIMSDTFSNLLTNDSLDCADEPREGYRPSNYAYPISGTIGIAELISTFVDLNESSSLQELTSGNSRVFADTLIFMTTVSGTVNPSVTITPVGHKWGLAAPTNFNASAKRIDKHQMLVGLSMEPSKPKAVQTAAATKAVPGVTGYPTKSALQKTFVFSSAEQRALDVLIQQRLDTFLDRATVIAVP